ncbi:WYL domain-containing protein [Williamsia sp. CHRR-6]|nr:WYL domain-containing protein [Williamsia sp. CHRR-6]
MAATSARLLRVLSLLTARPEWSGADLADRLGISARTLRRDIESLRDIGYPVVAVSGRGGGYALRAAAASRSGAGRELPPLLLDDGQAVAIAVALQTAPTTIAGIDDAAAGALAALRTTMPARLRLEVDAMHLITVRNYWEFPAPPIAAATLTEVGRAIRNGHVLRFEHLDADGGRPHPSEANFEPPRHVEPHHLLVWAGRWYLVAYEPNPPRGRTPGWVVLRVDRIRPSTPTGTPFVRRPLPDRDVARYVMRSHDRGDTPAKWPCQGSVLMQLPAAVVAEFAPGGSVVEWVTNVSSRLILGAWSWAGVAGLLATFDADLSEVEPAELRSACATLATRLAGASRSG